MTRFGFVVVIAATLLLSIHPVPARAQGKDAAPPEDVNSPAFNSGPGPRNVPSADPRDVPPAGPRDVPPTGPRRDVSPAGPRDVAPAGPRDVAPTGPRRDVSPAGPRDVVPAEPPAEERRAPAVAERWNSAASAIWRYRGQVHVAIGYSGVRDTADEARASALDACRKAGGSNCKAIGAWNSGCLYITTGRASSRAGWGSGGSIDAALKKCRSYGFSCKQPIGGCVD